MPCYEIMTIATMSAPTSHLCALIKKCVVDINKGKQNKNKKQNKKKKINQKPSDIIETFKSGWN
jgi:hypothetical protein